jgi:hypothetical protein
LQHGLHTLQSVMAQQHQRQGNVLRHIEMGQHMKGLEHKAQMGAPPECTGGVVQRGQIGAVVR